MVDKHIEKIEIDHYEQAIINIYNVIFRKINMFNDPEDA